MVLTLVSVEDGYNVFESSDGDEIVATPLPVAHTLTMWEDFDLSGAWVDAIAAHRENMPAIWSHHPGKTEFVAQVTRDVADSYEVTVEWCESCEEPIKGDVAESVAGGYACPSCYENNYRSCDECGDMVQCETITYTLGDARVCNGCIDSDYSYCEECDGYYHDSDSSEHTHGGCNCEPPTLAVAMRNGETTLTADERITVSLPAGVISEEGMRSIAYAVRDYAHDTNANPDSESRNKWWDFSYHVAVMDNHWQTKEGNFTKRLSKLAHKTSGLKVPAELLTQVGNIARDQSNGTDIDVELTRQLNLSAEDFYHEDSCWWQSYSDSRCSLKSNGGIGMRTFDANGFVKGRAWIMPLRADEFGNLQATFDAETADAYMVFNGYGDLSGYTPARVVAGMAGMTYRKISFDCSPMYVNGGSGYLVASEEIVSKRTSRVTLNVDTHSHLFAREAAAALVAA